MLREVVPAAAADHPERLRPHIVHGILLGAGLSHFSTDLLLDTCPCVCDSGYFAFADTVGTGQGVEECTVYYKGSFQCEGDPTIPALDEPTIMIEHHDIGCEPDVVGSASVCFYCIAPPPTDEQAFENVLVAKAGTCDSVWGNLVGVLPSCGGPSPAEHATWGIIKALYRKQWICRVSDSRTSNRTCQNETRDGRQPHPAEHRDHDDRHQEDDDQVLQDRELTHRDSRG